MEDKLIDNEVELDTLTGASDIDANNNKIPLRLLATVLNAALGAFCFGYNTASVAGAELYINKDSKFWDINSSSSQVQNFLSDWKKGLLVSCILLSGCIGALVASPVYNRIGARGAHFLQNIFFILGPISMAISNNYNTLVAARIFTGFGVGINSCICNLYISETSPAFCRGRLGGYGAFSVTAGILFSYIFSSIVGEQIDNPGVWRLMLGFGFIPAMLQFILSTSWLGYLPESPIWLKSKGRYEEANLSLKQLGLPSSVIPGQVRQVSPIASKTAAICTQSTRQALVAGIGINVLQQVCGINVVIYFGPQILKDAGFQNVESIALSAGVSVAQLGAIFFLMRIVDRVGRKPLAMYGVALMIIGLSIIAFAFYIIAQVQDAARNVFAPWLAVAGMLLFRIAFSLSLGPMPYIVTSELFSNAFRSKGVAISWASNWLSNFAVT